MYVTPELHRIGDANEMVLGAIDVGYDLDMTKVITDTEYPFPLPYPVPQD